MMAKALGVILDWLPALKSRKVRVGIATVIVAAAADLGGNLDPQIVLSIVGVGVSIILGIAIEDNGIKSRPPPPPINSFGCPIGVSGGNNEPPLSHGNVGKNGPKGAGE